MPSSSSDESTSNSDDGPNNKMEVMTFYPTAEEFSDFSKYIRYMESKGAGKAGMVKVIPPNGWAANKQMKANDISEVYKRIIEKPIEQNPVSKSRSSFQMMNEVQEAMSVKELEKLSQQNKYKAPENVMSIEELEAKFWKQLMFNPPIYGSDENGTLFDESQTSWNPSKLDTILDCVKIGEGKCADIRGVTSPYLYQ